MSIALGGAAMLEALTEAMTGMTMGDAYDQFMTEQFETDNGPPIGYGDYTSDTPAISGNTVGSISNGTPSVDPVDAWHDYAENDNPNVSEITGGIVSGSSVNTVPYSILGGPGATDLQAVMPVGVPIDVAIIAMGQAMGVSMNAANLDAETRNTLVNSYLSVSGVIYDKARELVTAWKDQWGNILFPKRAFDAVYDALQELDIGGDRAATSDLIDIAVPVGNAFRADSISGQYRRIYDYTFYGYAAAGTSWISLVAVSDAPNQVVGSRVETVIDVNTGTVIYQETTTISSGTSSYEHNGETVYYAGGLTITPSAYSGPDPVPYPAPDIAYMSWTAMYGDIHEGGYPEGTSESEAPSYTPSTIPTAGDLATSYDPDTGILGTEPVVAINIPENPYDTTGSTIDPTSPTDDENAGVIYPGTPGTIPDFDDPTADPEVVDVPIPLPIPDTKPSNPSVPLVDPSVVDSTLINELVEELANTLDPQAPQSSGIIPVPPLPGIFDPATEETTFPSIIPSSGPGFIHVYNPTPAEFVAFGTWLWVTYADATIDKILNNPFDGVIGAHELYATPNRDGSDNIRSAFLTCPTTAALVTNRYSEIDCGTVIVPEFYGNYLDYSPYSQAYIYLPFIGINEVSIDDIVGHAINIRYRIDSYSGSCIAMIFVAKDGYQNLCYQFAGSCSVEVPMAGGSQAAIKAGMMQAEAYARAAMIQAGTGAVGALGSALMGNIGGLLSSLSGIASNYAQAQAGVEAARVANKSSVQHSGQFGASHGAMGEKVPFIIIRNPIQVKVVNYNEDYGFPAHKRVIVGGCRGYLRVREVNVISAHATDEEKMAIEMALKGGVYVS